MPAALENSVAFAYVTLFASAIFFGVMYVPACKNRGCDGVLLQWHMSLGILATGCLWQLVTVLFLADLRGRDHLAYLVFVPWQGLLGGAFWAVSNALVLVTVKLLGLGIGFSLYCGVGRCMNCYLGAHFATTVGSATSEPSFTI